MTKTLLQISVEVNYGSVGRLAEQIGLAAINENWNSYICYARGYQRSKSSVIKIGNKLSIYLHGAQSRIFDNHCLCSTRATIKLIKQIDKIKPDIILLHHIHGYYINMKILFSYFNSIDTPLIWLFHDFWAITGHCAHFAFSGCEKWKDLCYSCQLKTQYPASYILDKSTRNYRLKRTLFTSLPVNKLTIITVSKWQESIIRQSYMNKYKILTIYNAVDTDLFHPCSNVSSVLQKYHIENKKVILGVATSWNEMKGLSLFFELANKLNANYKIVLVGLTNNQIKKLPSNIQGIKRTENIKELALLYSAALIHLSLSKEETFGLTIVESMSCGTPVVASNVAALKELVTEKTGILVDNSSMDSIIEAIYRIDKIGKDNYSPFCRKRSITYFSKKVFSNNYIKLMKSLIKN